MIKKNLAVFLLITICSTGFFACKKVNNSTVDPTRNYFPITFGQTVTYDVDSVYYNPDGTSLETRCQLEYVITDSFTNPQNQTSYLLNVFYHPYNGSSYQLISNSPNNRVIYVTPTANSILYTQDGTEYIKMMFPVQNGLTWQGNQYAQVQNAAFAYLANWNYVYQNYHLSYFNGLVNYDNTVTVLEDNDNVNYQNVDPLVAGERTYAKEVYAYNVGMVYKEWTYYTWTMQDTTEIKNGYSVIMRAINNQ